MNLRARFKRPAPIPTVPPGDQQSRFLKPVLRVIVLLATMSCSIAITPACAVLPIQANQSTTTLNFIQNYKGLRAAKDRIRNVDTLAFLQGLLGRENYCLLPELDLNDMSRDLLERGWTTRASLTMTVSQSPWDAGDFVIGGVGPYVTYRGAGDSMPRMVGQIFTGFVRVLSYTPKSIEGFVEQSDRKGQKWIDLVLEQSVVQEANPEIERYANRVWVAMRIYLREVAPYLYVIEQGSHEFGIVPTADELSTHWKVQAVGCIEIDGTAYAQQIFDFRFTNSVLGQGEYREILERSGYIDGKGQTVVTWTGPSCRKASGGPLSQWDSDGGASDFSGAFGTLRSCEGLPRTPNSAQP